MHDSHFRHYHYVCGDDMSGKDLYEYVKSNKNLLTELPEPGEEWEGRDAPDEIKKRLDALDNRGIISKVGHIPANGYRGIPAATLWETDADAYEYIQEKINTSSSITPCDCLTTNIRNEANTEGITCLNCDVVHAKEDLAL